MPLIPPRPTTATGPATGGALLDGVVSTRAGAAAAVVAGAATIGLSAQVAVPLPWTPIPFTLQTLAVLLCGATLGPRRGPAAALVYLLAGSVGVPWFAPRAGAAATGYLIGFVLATALVGAAVTRDAHPTRGRTAAVLAAGDLVILLTGSAGVALVLGVGPGRALLLGLVPFLAGDAVKVAAATLLVPATRRLTGAVTGRDGPDPT